MSESSRPSVTYSAAKLTPILPVTTSPRAVHTHAQRRHLPQPPAPPPLPPSSVSIPTVTRISFSPAAAAAAAAFKSTTTSASAMSGQHQLPLPPVKVEPRLNGYGMPEAVSQVPTPAAHLSLNQAGAAVEDNKDWQTEQQCCLIENGRRCLRPAGNASYSKRIQKTVTQKKLKLYMDNRANHIYICDYHKNMIQSLRQKRKRKDSEDDSGETDSEHPEVDLFQLQVNTLRRYEKHFKVSSRPGLNKAQLADTLMNHFKGIPVVEKEALTFFIYMIKTNKSKLDRERRDDID